MSEKIFDINYLCESVLTDYDINCLVESDSLTKSFIVYQYRLIGDRRTENEILDECKHNRWYDKKCLSKENLNILREKLAKAYYNIYRYPNVQCNQIADMWILNYAFLTKIYEE